jgi:hypothetical protein
MEFLANLIKPTELFFRKTGRHELLSELLVVQFHYVLFVPVAYIIARVHLIICSTLFLPNGMLQRKLIKQKRFGFER